MTRERFMRLVSQAIDELPAKFRARMKNVVVLVHDVPEQQRRRRHPRPRTLGRSRDLLTGVFIGTAATQKSVFDTPLGPDHIILYQKNIESLARSEAEVRREVRQTLIHELGHYFGLSEDELRDV